MSDRLKIRITNIIDDIESRHCNDPALERGLSSLNEILLENEADTIKFLKTCDERTFYWTATSLIDIASKFSSEDLLCVIECLSTRFSRYHIFENDFTESKAIIMEFCCCDNNDDG